MAFTKYYPSGINDNDPSTAATAGWGNWVQNAVYDLKTIVFHVDDFAGVDDYTTISNAIAALNAAGTGTLRFSGRTYDIGAHASLPTITAVAKIEGGGRAQTIIQRSTRASADILTLNTDYSSVRDLTIKDTGTGTPTSGAALVLNAGYGYVENCNLGGGCWSGIRETDNAYGARIHSNYITGFYKYGWYRPYSGSNPDQGADILTKNIIDTGVAVANSSCIYAEAHGSLHILGNKILRCDYGVDVRAADGVSTSDLLISGGNSIENQTVMNIRVLRLGTTGVWNKVVIVGNQMQAAAGNTANITIGLGTTGVILNGLYMNGGATGGTGISIGAITNVLLDNLVITSQDTGISINSGATTVHLGDNIVHGARTTDISDTGSNLQTRFRSTKMGFFGAVAVTQPGVSGSRGGNAALASLLTQLANLGLITDSSTV